MSTYLLITPKEDELYHYGVKGQKWGVRRSPAELATASAGPGGGAIVENIDELEESINEAELKLAEMKAEGANAKEIKAMEASIKAGKEKVNQMLDMERRNKSAFNLQQSDSDEDFMMAVMELTPSDLEHHGIKGQKWGIRRFQPYRQGMKVAGGKVVGAAKKVKQRFKDIGDARQKKKAAKAKAEAVKKAQATRKANANFEAEKKKAIESGSIEDLAKFKGKLTNEEYSKAFLRLQNEKKMSDMVAANQKTVWDTIDKGMSIVQKVGGYANTIATAKENFTKLDKAFNGERDKEAEDAKKSIKEAEKNRALTQVTNITELDKVQKDLNLNADDYAKGLRIISTKEAGKKAYGAETFTNQDKAKNTPVDGTYRSKDDIKKNASYDNSDPKDFEKPQKAYEKTPSSIRDKAAYKNPDGESGGAIGIRGQKWIVKENVDSGKRVISGFKSSTDKPVSYNSQQTLSFGESTVKRLSAKSPEPSKIVTDTRKTVADTQAEAARQREEADKKRKKAFGK